MRQKARTGENVLGQVALHVAHSVQIANVHERISGAARHAGVDLSDDDVSALGSGTRGFDASAHGAESVLICTSQRRRQTHREEKGGAGTRSCDSCHYGGGQEPRRRKWEPTVEHVSTAMYVIVLSTVHGLARVTANEEVARVEDAVKLCASCSNREKTRIRVGGISQSQQMRHFDVLQTAGLGRLHSKDGSGIAHLADRVQKTQGRAGSQMNPHLVSALDATNHFFRRAHLGHLSRNSC